MGKFQPLPIVGGCYADDSRPYSVQDTVNYLPIKAEASGTRSEGKLVCVPGLVPFCGTNQAPIRGAHNCEGRYFVVAGTTFYLIGPRATRTVLGTIPGTGRVCFDHNQITGGNEVVVVNGSQGFVYNTKTGVFAQITDPDFPGSAIARYLGQYILGIKPNRTGWFHSDLATATTWLSTDTYEAESSPDLLVDIQVSQGRALIMGERTIEEWVNEPTENAAFQRGSVIERGAASAFANVIMDNTLIWLGDDGIVYRLDGYTPRRISTFPIEQALSRNTLANAFAFAWEDRGHKVYYLTLPDGHTWGYDIASGLWHRRESYRLDRWVANTMTRWNGAWYAGHYDSGVIYRLDWDVMREGCDQLVRSRTLACIHDNENRLTVDAVALTVDVGTEPSIDTHGPPSIRGDLPDATVGDSVVYQYIVTGSYPGEAVTVTAGALPDGLSISSSGLVTGTVTTAGNYAWTLTVTGECDFSTLADGNTVTAPDVVASRWWMTSGAGAQRANVWESSDLSGAWAAPVVRTPNMSTSDFGPLSLAQGRVLIAGFESTLDLVDEFDPAGGYGAQTKTLAANINKIRQVGSYTFAFNTSSSTYWVSADYGDTWTSRTSFGTRKPQDIARMTSGRWIAFVADGANSRFVYSDQADEPTAWTDSTTTPTPSMCITLNGAGTVACGVAWSGGVMRTTDGATWSFVAVAGITATGANVAGVAIGDVMVMSAKVTAGGFLIRSTDAGASWVTQSSAQVRRLETNGATMAQMFAVVGGVGARYSTDLGATWNDIAMPYAVSTADLIALAPVRYTTPTPVDSPAVSAVYLVDENDNPLTDESGNHITG